MSDGGAIDDVWSIQSRWSQVADRLKRRIDRYRSFTLWTIVIVAVLGGLASALATAHGPTARVLAATAAVGTALLPLLRRSWTGRVVRDWTRARAVAEAIKSEVHLWLVRAGNYRSDPGVADLRNRVDAIRDDAAELLRYHQGVTAVQRSLPAVSDTRSYVDVRVRGQVRDYYRPAAARLTRRLVGYHRAEVGLAVAGALIGGFSAYRQQALAAWIAVAAAIAAALGIHVAASRIDYLLIQYLRTAEQLDRLAERAAADGYADGSVPITAENLITAENNGWMAKLTEAPVSDH